MSRALLAAAVLHVPPRAEPDRVGLVDATALPAYDLGAGHPFARDRQEALFDLMRRHALFSAEDLLPVRPATEDELRLAHDADYIAAIKALSEPHPSPEALARAPRYGMGTADDPIVPGLHAAAAAVAGGTLCCVRAVLSGERRAAFHPAGGLHHAMRAQASGFCIYNDLVVGIAEALRLGAERVLYVDFDVHHGDGVQAAFEDDPRVLTISFHETPLALFPGTGFAEETGRGKGRGTVINVPLPSYTDSAGWLAAVRRVLPEAARRFRPDLIVSQHGCDTHATDPLATLRVDVQTMAEAAGLTRALADELCDGRWVATGGGGYRPYTVLPRVWAWVWAILAGRRLPEHLDEGWRNDWRARTGEAMPATFADP
ncbi:MAG TPA: acetoin utilization protein AcuC [Planctomycetota bacterium]|nr:acetoin utilization protein AcuC [Planctomycetota bacterium]